MEYHKIILDCMEFLDCDTILNIHSHDPDLSKTDTDILIYSPVKTS